MLSPFPWTSSYIPPLFNMTPLTPSYTHIPMGHDLCLDMISPTHISYG